MKQPKEFSLALKKVLGKEDYEWLTQWLVKNKAKEAEVAEKRGETVMAKKLREISPEDYLFCYLGDPEIKKKLKTTDAINKHEDTERFTQILAKLRLAKIWVDGTLL